MEYKIKDFTSFLEEIAPLSSQEDYDNSGLIIGDHQTIVKGILLSLDCTEEVVDEAIKCGANLIISHHPIIFRGLKKINGKNYVERTIIKAIQNNIALYAIHTNLDNSKIGVNAEIAKRIGLVDEQILAPQANLLKKLVFTCPKENTEEVKQAIFKAGGGKIGNYRQCSFENEGLGAFLPIDNAEPTIGTIGKYEKVIENRVEILISNYDEQNIVSTLKAVHPYEEVAYEIYPISNKNQDLGAGMIGELETPMETKEFLQKIKTIFNCGTIRYTELVKEKILKVAICGGSGSFLLKDALCQEADIFITADFKYHEFFDAEKKIIIADIGHFESEQFTPNLIYSILTKKFINFAIHLSKVNTNPINYF